MTVAVKLDIFSNFYEKSALPEKSFVAVSDFKGIRLYYYPAQNDTNPISKRIRTESWNIAEKGDEDGFFLSTGSDGLRRIIAYEKVRLHQDTLPYLYVWAGIPEEHILKAANASLTRNILLLFLVTLTSLFISWIIGRNTLIAPIQYLVALTRRFAREDFETRGELADHAGEFGVLTRAFNEMAESLLLSRKTLLESETKFRSKMEAMTDPIYICSPEFQVEYMNSAMIRIVGYDATGEFCFKCVHGLNEKCSWCKYDNIQHG